MKCTKLLLTATLLVCVGILNAQQTPPKREFRGAWIQAVNGQWQGIGRTAMQAELTRELDALQADGINAILFQCRVEGDALYESTLEPWSRYLTGQQGTPPSPSTQTSQIIIDTNISAPSVKPQPQIANLKTETVPEKKVETPRSGPGRPSR